MSWAVEVVADEAFAWLGNSLRFKTREEAVDYAASLCMRWTAVSSWRVRESWDPVNAGFQPGKLFTTENGHGSG